MAYLFLVLGYAHSSEVYLMHFYQGTISTYSAYIREIYNVSQIERERQRKSDRNTKGKTTLKSKKIDLTAIFHAALLYVCAHTWIQSLATLPNVLYTLIKYISMCVFVLFPRGVQRCLLNQAGCIHFHKGR